MTGVNDLKLIYLLPILRIGNNGQGGPPKRNFFLKMVYHIPYSGYFSRR